MHLELSVFVYKGLGYEKMAFGASKLNDTMLLLVFNFAQRYIDLFNYPNFF